MQLLLTGDLLVSISPEEGDAGNDSGGDTMGDSKNPEEGESALPEDDLRSGNGAARVKEGDGSDDLDSNPILAS